MGPDINNQLTIGLVTFAVIVAGAFAGWKAETTCQIITERRRPRALYPYR